MTDTVNPNQADPGNAMYERAYWNIQKTLDGVLGTEAEDSAGGGIVADVLLVIQRYQDLRRVVLAGRAWPGVVRQIEAAPLRDDDTDPPNWTEPTGWYRDDATGLISGGWVTD